MLLPEARGLAERSVRSWTAGQDFARERFEVLVVTNGRERRAEARIASLLGVPDRLLPCPGATRAELYDRGARTARGEFVVFTESHCLAAPSFLGAMDRYLLASGAPAAFSRTTGLYSGALSRLEGRCALDGFRRYQMPDDWRKVNIHSFALRRAVFLQAGGFQTRYGIFSEMILAAELWRRGYRAELAAAPPVAHLFDGRPRGVVEYQRDVVAGEMRYYRDHPHGPRIEHTYLADGDVPWAQHELERAALGALWAERRGAIRPALRQGWRVLKLAAREGRVGRAFDHIRMRLAAVGCRVLGSERDCALRLFRWMWAAGARLARKEYLATEAPEPARTPAPVSLAIDEIPERDLWGFHLPERWQGRALRWTGRCAVLRLPRPHSGELSLMTYGIGWPAKDRLRSVHINGARLPPEAVSVEWDRVRVRLGPVANPGPLLLALICDPVGPDVCGPEPRELGIPLLRVEGSPETDQLPVAA
jgi:hypothetical protein